MSETWIGGGKYQQYGEIRKIALEMALDRYNGLSVDDDTILFAAEQFFEFLTTGAPVGIKNDQS